MAETILIVEDNLETLELLRRIMERDGYETICANDGEKGLSYAGRYLPDLIILDRLMPKLNGLQVCKKLKEQEATRNIPVVFLSILDSEHDVIEGLRAGADDYITKPFSPDELSVRVQRVLFRSVRSTIEDLITERAAPDDPVDCFTPLVEKLTVTEKGLREKTVRSMASLVERGRRWNALLREQQVPGNQNEPVNQQTVSRELCAVDRYAAFFTETLTDYTLLRWLIGLLYRSERGAGRQAGRQTGLESPGKNQPGRTLRRMYAETAVIMNRIRSALRILDKTDECLRRRRE